MNLPPPSADCLSLLADGRLLTITATRRPRANRAEVKCVLAGAPALCERMQEVVRLARHTEPCFDSRDQVVLSMDALPSDQERDWELAAVLADRMARGVYRPAGLPVMALGWSDAWHLGRVDGRPAAALERVRRHAALARAPRLCILGGDGDLAELRADSDPDGRRMYLRHLGGLTGHADPGAAVSCARAWFPLHSGGINDSLSWIEVGVRPLEAGGASGASGPDPDDDDAIAVPGLDATAQLAVRLALAGARHFDGRALGRWRTVVRFGQPRFQGTSYQLALVMADRLARGREWVPRGRVIASGASSAWHAGRVEPVEARVAKMALILSQASGGDRVLLPAAWHAEDEAEADAFEAGLRQKDASVAWIERIGLM